MIFGHFNILPENFYNLANKITMFGLIVLLFSMGLGIGSNSDLLNNLDTLGLQAFLLALGSVLGSIIVTWYLQKWIFRGDKK